MHILTRNSEICKEEDLAMDIAALQLVWSLCAVCAFRHGKEMDGLRGVAGRRECNRLQRVALNFRVQIVTDDGSCRRKVM